MVLKNIWKKKDNKIKAKIWNDWYIVYSDGQIYSLLKYKFLKLTIDYRGYQVVTLRDKKKYQVHQIIAQNFVKNPDKKLKVVHLDNNLQNNNASNLKWANSSEVSYRKSLMELIKYYGTN